MNSSELKDIGIKSCTDMYEQVSFLQENIDPKDSNVSTVINDIKYKRPCGDYWEIGLFMRLQDADRVRIRIIGKTGKVLKEFDFRDVRFDEYDEIAKTIRAYVSDDLNELFLNCDTNQVKIVSDMKWLIELTRNMFEDYGQRIGYPKRAPHFTDKDYTFPRYSDNRQPTQQQRDSVHTILNSEMAYIWGAPGTGKTQMVLSTAILAHIKKGGRVAIIAPTNNSLEQVLMGVMKVISSDDPEGKYIVPERDIIRLGIPTHKFIQDYKCICEDKAIAKKIREIDEQLKNLDQVQLASTAEFSTYSIDTIKDLIRKRDEAKNQYMIDQINTELDSSIDSIKNMFEPYDSLRGIIDDVTHLNISNRIGYIETQIDLIDKSRLRNETYAAMDGEQIREKRRALLEERGDCERNETKNKIKTVKIMAMTPYILMARRRMLFDEGGITQVDQIFIDEVGYSNLMQTLPVFMCGPPVAMLGDHMQLPPVCEIDSEVLSNYCTEPIEDDYMKYGFMWDQSILNVERYLSGTIDECIAAYVGDCDPMFGVTKRCDLTESHRFSDNLAKILDKCVYMNGIKGIGEDPVKIECIDVVNDVPRDSRKNPKEVDAVADYIERKKNELDDFVILTPYSEQKVALINRLPKLKDCIMTIHSSQGREWNTVIISISDDGQVGGKDVQLRFTSSTDKLCQGLKLMNTAVSRAKKKIVLVCNYEFWKERSDKEKELLAKLVEAAEIESKWSC